MACFAVRPSTATLTGTNHSSLFQVVWNCLRRTLRSVLLKQFQTTWNKEEWFVPVSVAVDGLTAKQAMWKPNDSSHSVGELAYHLLFWNKQSLDKFYDRKPAPFNGDNNTTFTKFTEESWAATVKELNEVMAQWEKAISEADDAKLEKWYPTI